MPRPRSLLLGLAAVVGLAGAAWLLTRPDPLVVSVITAERGRVAASVANTRAGTVKACRRAGLAPQRGGQIASLPVAEGQAVTAGQLLLELWNADLRAQLSLAQRDARAVAARARESCVLAEVAEREARRLKRLQSDKLASEEQTERAIGEAESRAAGCTAASEAVSVAEARIRVAEAALEPTLLRAPFDGVIAEINGELGEFVTPSPVGIPTPPTVDLVDVSCLFISAPIDEVDAPAVRAGQPALVNLDAFPGRKFDGIVRRVAPYVLDLEKQARTVEIEAEIRDPDQSRLLPGYSADVEVLLETREGVLRVPTQVVLDGNRVFVLDEQAGVLRERTVQTGLSNWEYTEITSGLDDGELVVLSVDREGVGEGARARRD